MVKLIKAFCLLAILSACALAQASGDEYKKNEFFVGYSNQQIDQGEYQTANGFEVSATRNISRYFGIKGDVSGAYRKDDFSYSFDDGTGTISYSGRSSTAVYNFLGGIQIKDNATKSRFKPFAHALAGVAHTRNKTSNFVCQGTNCPQIFDSTFTSTGFALAAGGGLDIKINDRIDFRAIQVDYNPTFNYRRDNIRIGIGFVFK